MAQAPHIYLKLWLQQESNILLGLGRAQLLKKVDELGSLSTLKRAEGFPFAAARETPPDL
jgi:molybdenum-dependent DNA-binding transcriptional regulator ModE